MRWNFSHLLMPAAIFVVLSWPLLTSETAFSMPEAEDPYAETPSSDGEPIETTADDANEPTTSSDEPAEAPQVIVRDNAKERTAKDSAVKPRPASVLPATKPANETHDPYAEKPAPSSKPLEGDTAPGALPPSPKVAELVPVEPRGPMPQRVALDPATLDGVHPGSTTQDELHEKWGQPELSQRVAGGARETYRLDKLGRVRATIFEAVVSSLTVHIEQPAPLASVAQRLALGDVEPVDVYDEHGDLLGAAFPERGVLLGYLPRSQPPRVFQILIESIDAQPFLARAEVRLRGRYAESMADVEQALTLAPDNPQAHHLRGELLLKQGELNKALQSAERAAELEPQTASHRLLLARILAAAGDYPQAINRLRDLLGEPDLNDLDAARASCLWGDYLAHSHLNDCATAITYHQQAIQLAEPLLGDPERSMRRAAKELLLDAHLGVAYDIGRGHWQQKTTAVAKWVDRAAVFADDLMRSEHAGAEMRLRVYLGALDAIGGIVEPPDVSKWVASTRQLGQKLYEAAKDSTYRAELAWQLGRALSEVVEIEIARGQSDEAFNSGALARSLFDEAQPVAEKLPMYNYERGTLYYRLGVAYATERKDHAQAVVWFDRAAPLLESPVPAAAINAGTHGEAFVSMAVSYWDQQNRHEALRLTNQGLKLMEQAVEEGSLEAASLAVPYNNLAAMHEELGDPEQAKWCADLATRYEAAANTK